ncbi:uncharacterized protein LOC142537286 [Primulina tabacum]|uniref:uncharacterized protein LOC142537286 n=1 Tax=Primulina tabacum TaxID=48773 RepID=UPI003F5AC6C9
MEDGVEDLLDLFGDEEQEQHHARGGVIGDLISAFVSKNSAEEEDKGQEKDGKFEENEKSPSEEGGGFGSGLMDDLVSHLPAASDIVVAAPSNDEASILIHSVVHE